MVRIPVQFQESFDFRGIELYGSMHQAALAAGVACMCLGKDTRNTSIPE